MASSVSQLMPHVFEAKHVFACRLSPARINSRHAQNLSAGTDKQKMHVIPYTILIVTIYRYEKAAI